MGRVTFIRDAGIDQGEAVRVAVFFVLGAWLLIVLFIIAILHREPNKVMDGEIEILHSGVE